MIDYNKKLDKIAGKYLYKREKGFLETGKFVERAIHELFGFYRDAGYQIRYVVGMRESTTMFYKMVPEFPVELIPYDKEETVDWGVLTATDAVLVIGSFNASRRVERRYWNNNWKCMIVNLFDYFYLRGYELHANFWEYCLLGGDKKERIQRRRAFLRHHYFQYGIWHKVLNLFPVSDQLAYNAIWSRTYCLRKAYESKQGNLSMHTMYLQRFIFECVKGRDYLTAKKYIQEYIEGRYENAVNYQKFLMGWDSLLEKMKNKIGERCQEDFIINWLDAVSRDRAENMPYLCELAKDNTQLSRAYTVTPWTSWCIKSIFMGTGAIEGKLYRYKKITDKNFKLMKELKDHKYRFFYLGPRIFQKKVFLNRDCASIEMREYEISFTYYYWKLLCLLAASRKKLFVIVHELYATHPPYFSPGLSWFEEGSGEYAGEEQKAISCRYMDEQLRWWDSFLNEKICRIYMGDHGDSWNLPNFDYLKKRTNVLFLIKNGKRKLKRTDGFFSLKNMGKLIEYIMLWNDRREESIYSDDVRIEEFDRYDSGAVETLLSEKREKYEDYRNWMQFRAIRTETDMLVKYVSGQEWYFRLPDEETNHVKDLKYRERVQDLREKLGEEFVNIWEEDFFRHSRRLYQEQEKHRDNQ